MMTAGVSMVTGGLADAVLVSNLSVVRSHGALMSFNGASETGPSPGVPDGDSWESA